MKEILILPDDPFAIWKIPRIIDLMWVWESRDPTVSVPKAPLLGSQRFCPSNSFGSLPASSHLTCAAFGAPDPAYVYNATRTSVFYNQSLCFPVSLPDLYLFKRQTLHVLLEQGK